MKKESASKTVEPPATIQGADRPGARIEPMTSGRYSSQTDTPSGVNASTAKTTARPTRSSA